MYIYLKKNKLLSAVVILFILIYSVFDLIKAHLFKYNFDMATGEIKIDIKNLIMINIFFIIFYGVIKISQEMAVEKLLFKIRFNLNNDLLLKLLNRPINDYFKSYGTSDIISKFNNDINIIIDNYFRSLLNILYFAASFIMSVIYIFNHHYYFIIYVVITTSFPLIVNKIFANKIALLQKDVNNSFKSLIKQVKDYFNNYQLIKSNNVESSICKKFSQINTNNANKIYKNNIIQKYLSTINSINGFIIFLGINIIGLVLIFNGKFTVGGLVAVSQAANGIVNPIFAFSTLLNNLNSTKYIRDDINNVFATEKNDEGQIINEFRDISFRGVRYKYGDRKVLKNIDLNIELNKKYALVGQSGSGKTTLIKILTKQLSEYDGEIKINNIELKSISYNSLYRNIAIVDQENSMLTDSIKNNIIMYKELDEERFLTVLKSVQLKEFIDSLEEKEDYILNEETSNLSGGQRQRISIARALYHGAKLIILDESFSSLDNTTARLVESDILDLHNIGILSITHKLDESILKKYDEILVLDQGEIVEQGTYHELIQNKDYFYRLKNNLVSYNKSYSEI